MTKTTKPTSMYDDIRLPKAFTDRLQFTSLTEDEKQAIIQRAEKQVRDELKAQEEEAFLKLAVKHARQKHIPAEEMQLLVVDLPGHSASIVIDGREFMHGFTYEEPKPVCETLREIIQRAWNHEDDVGGANRSFYHQPSAMSRPRGIRLTRGHATMPARDILRGA